MTRINASIKPSQLCDQHLLAEYRELPRVIALANNYKGNDIPKKFTLGKGHVTFFYDKLLFLHGRFLDIVQELKRRSFVLDSELLSAINKSFLECDSTIYKVYRPTREAHAILSTRIKERLNDMVKITYYSKPITANEAFKLITYANHN